MGELFSQDEIDKVIEDIKPYWRDDAISRQEAIDAFSMFAEYESNRTNAEWVDRIRVVLSSLPPVQPIRPRCGDCKYYQNDSNGLYGECFYHSIDKLKPNGDWFCTDFEEEQA